MDRPYTVSLLSKAIADRLADLGAVTVQGELSQVKVHTSGHLYATLKDGEAIISLVMWRSTVVRQGAMPKEGASVVVRGSISVYAPRGQYQLVATRIQPVGEGDLAARLEQLKAKLAAEGLFAEERKRPLPFLPRAVGLATAAGSAALADMLHSLRARFPRMHIVHAHCAVQGVDAPVQIVRAIARLAAHPQVDVIVAGRGGGSLEDLWAFNDERVVRAIATCPTPIVSAVGHETDTTLADHAADLRAKTPTAAAELVVPVEADLRAALTELREQLDAAADRLLTDARTRLAALDRHRALAGPDYQVLLRRQRLDELSLSLGAAAGDRLMDARRRHELIAQRLRAAMPVRRIDALAQALPEARRRLTRALDQRLRHGGERIAGLAARLDALSPLAVLARGYAIVRDARGAVVRRAAEVARGDTIDVKLGEGTLRARVE